MEERFTTTIWTGIRRAQERSASATDTFVKKYRPPVFSFIRSQGYSAEDSEDLAQEVFLTVFRSDLLARAERSRGRFRSFLLGVVKNVIRNAARTKAAAKRGGGAGTLPLDQPLQKGETRLVDLLQARARDECFDGNWLQNLVRLAIERLARSYPRGHQVFTMHFQERKSYQEIGTALELGPKQVDNLLQQSRRKLRDLIRAEIEATCSSNDEFEEEFLYLKRFLAPSERPEGKV